jgi:hypothetical protein
MVKHRPMAYHTDAVAHFAYNKRAIVTGKPESGDFFFQPIQVFRKSFVIQGNNRLFRRNMVGSGNVGRQGKESLHFAVKFL